MRREVFTSALYETRYAEWIRTGISLSRADDALRILAAGGNLEGRGYGDHPLRGRLEGWRAAVVAALDEVDQDGRPITVLMVYYVDSHNGCAVTVNAHDAAYAEALLERARKAGRPSRQRRKLLHL